MQTLFTLLEQSLEDNKLQTQEKNELEQSILAANLDEEDLSQLRNKAFDLAKQNLNNDNAYNLIKWLERIVKVIDKTRPEAGESKTFFSPGQDCLNEIIWQLGKAKSTIDICVFTITDNRISAAIIDAHERGVKVRIISDNDKALDKGSDIQRLMNADMLLRLDKTDNHMHHKFAVIDGATLINGSFNWTRSATDYNHENIVSSSDKQLISQFQRVFEQLWHKFA